jgi:hypothetical protein
MREWGKSRNKVGHNTADALRCFYPITACCEQYLPKLQYVVIEKSVEVRKRGMINKNGQIKDMGNRLERKEERFYVGF